MLLMSIIVQILGVHTYTVFIYLISVIIPQNHFQFRSQHLFGTEMVFTHNHHFNWESYFDPPETVFNFGVTVARTTRFGKTIYEAIFLDYWPTGKVIKSRDTSMN